MKTLNLLIFSILLFLFANNSCDKKDDQPEILCGCMDKEGINYDPLAVEDDSSCIYQGSIVFWYNKDTYDSLLADNTFYLYYSLDTLPVMKLKSSFFFPDSPECGQRNSATFVMGFGPLKTMDCNYSIKDMNGREYWKGNIKIIANTCGEMELNWSDRFY